MARGLDYGRDAWVLIFAASFILSIVATAIQYFRAKELWESPLIPALLVLHLLWISILTLWLIASAIGWIWWLVDQV